MAVSLAGGVNHPKIYAYTVDQYAETPWVGKRTGKGLIKVGETSRDVLVRIREQLSAIKMPIETVPTILLSRAAITNDGRIFTDHEVHRALKRAGYHNVAGEWFEATKDEVEAAIQAVRDGVELPPALPTFDFKPRPEQEHAIAQTAAYFRSHARKKGEQAPDFLWNAKMRFGKTFTSYELAREMGWSRILVLTFKPAVEAAWREDLRHQDFVGWRFKGKDDPVPDLNDPSPLVWFASFQDVLGKGDDGQSKKKNKKLYQEPWDVVIVDEYHFGAWRDAARSLYIGEKDEVTGEVTEGDKSEEKSADTPDVQEDISKTDIEGKLEESLDVDHFLYLSGTPFRALTNGEFLEDQVFNWTYADEQRAKKDWKGSNNPYASLPRMHLLAYEMPDALREVALNSMSEFSLTEFFKTKKDEVTKKPVFIHEVEVQKWLNLLQGQDLSDLWAAVSTKNPPPMPYEDTNLLTALQHTVWYLPGVDACYAMEELLSRSHNTFFRDYSIIVAAGSKAGQGQAALGPVEAAITNIPQDHKSITLSCGKLMTGVTVPAWGGIFMLRELKSPETYFQAAFRVQSPWAYKTVDTTHGGDNEVVVKEHCYVLDFSPNRALRLIVEYATKLRPSAAAETDEEASIEEFMEFLPVLAFSGSTMQKVSAADVIDYLTKGISSSMLARRWNSPELISLNLASMEAILADAALVKSLESIEMFRNISDDLTAMISSNKELKAKKLAGEKPTKEEKKEHDEAKKKRDDIKKKLQRFLTRIPAFMYLTDDREKAVVDLIRQEETALFETVTTLSLKDFERLVNAGAFNGSKMDDAVWKFRQFEEPSLTYTAAPEKVMVGGWLVRRDERFAELIEKGRLTPGDTLTNSDQMNPALATVSEDFGLLVGGLRFESPSLAAAAASGDDGADGWTYWSLVRDGKAVSTLQELRTGQA